MIRRIPSHLLVVVLLLAASGIAIGRQGVASGTSTAVRPTAAPTKVTVASASPDAAPPTATVVEVDASPGPTPPPPTSVPATATAAPDFQALKPNELGKIMVLQYHNFGDEEDRWTRTWDNFRADLEYLYRNGYYLTPMADLVDNRVQVPAGKTPVVLTLDDSTRSQFQLIEEADGTLRPDPQSAVGILDAFTDEHPDFGRAAVFCILPGADPPNDFFGQPEYRERKLQHLAERGYEICNHTLWHADLQSIDREETIRQLALANKAIQDAVPGYRVEVFDPPFGQYPEDIGPLLEGTHEGISYRHRVILEVDEGVLTAPGHRETDFLHVPRLQAFSELLEKWFDHFEELPEERYVSDGAPDRMVFPVAQRADYAPIEGAQDEPSPDPAYTVIRLRSSP